MISTRKHQKKKNWINNTGKLQDEKEKGLLIKKILTINTGTQGDTVGGSSQPFHFSLRDWYLIKFMCKRIKSFANKSRVTIQAYIFFALPHSISSFLFKRISLWSNNSSICLVLLTIFKLNHIPILGLCFIHSFCSYCKVNGKITVILYLLPQTCHQCILHK